LSGHLKHTWPMKSSADIVFGTPPGGAIILGREDGIPLALAVADTAALGLASWMMLEPTTMLVALSDPVAF